MKVKANAEIQNDGLLTIWRDLTTEPVWKYDESPPFMLSQLTEVELLQASDSELARSIWFWCRRPKLMFHDSVAPAIVAFCILISLFIGLVNWAGTSMPERVAEVIILLFEVAVEIYREAGTTRLAVLVTGAFFGEMALLASAPRNATVRCLESMTVLSIPKREFGLLAANVPGLRASFEQVGRERPLQ